MLFTLAKEPVNSDDWLYEIKYDGYRIQAHILDASIVLYSRNLKNFTADFPSICQALKSVQHDVILDGEIIALDDSGNETWDLLRTKSKGNLIYMVFDILYLNGHSLINLSFEQRRSLLNKAMMPTTTIKITETFTDGTGLFERVKKAHLEGIVAKRKDSTYTPGKRSSCWLKIPNIFHEEFIIGGWLEGKGRNFAALLIGYNRGKDFVYAGSLGTGFKEKEVLELKTKLSKLSVEKCPFMEVPLTDGIPHWVKPLLVVGAKYKSWTTAGKLRRPVVYTGLRPDMKLEDVHPSLPNQ